MSEGTIKSLKIIFVLAASVVLEIATFYAYSRLFMIEGQPQRHSDPGLKLWAWLSLAAMFLELLGGIWLVVKICKS